MERFVLEQLAGVNRNAVEGVSPEPDLLSGVEFNRAGGYSIAGARNQNWLGSRALSGIDAQDGFNLLLEDSGLIQTNWQPSEFMGTEPPIAYDETGLALFDSGRIWSATEFYQAQDAQFLQGNTLSLAPRTGVLKAWRQSGDTYTGGAIFFNESGSLMESNGPGTASYTENAGSGLAAGVTYEFRWLVEAKTDNGLVVHAVGVSAHLMAGNADSLDIDLSTVYSEGTVTRFYYRNAAWTSQESAGFERFALHVSNGVDAPTASLVAPLPSPFAPTDELLVNFAPGRLEAHNGRMWGKATDYMFTPLLESASLRASNSQSFQIPVSGLDPNAQLNPDLAIVYSDVGTVNRGKADNFIRFSPTASESITGLASTPAGLLVFFENETYLVRGDPLTQDLAVQRLSGTVGNDSGVIPAKFSGVVMPIYQGEIYAVTLGGGDVDFGGGLVNISQPVWIPDDPFEQVIAEPVRNDIIARTFNGRVYRMYSETRAWINNQFDEISGLSALIPSPPGDVYGTRYVIDGYLEVVDDSLHSTPTVQWESLDLGDKNLMKLWRRIEMFTGDSAAGTPTLAYNIRGQSGAVTGLDQGRGRWIFTFPRGIVGPKADLTFTFTGAASDFTLEPPVVIEYAPRYRER